ncbi:capsid assembly scaffolding protein [Ralstonia phage P-PSG-11-1]|uniref:Capsid assembly scaffolding protein n=1 Tax=Ralstonia phage P-PSG-11 TaxID=2652430 RepID=A0A5P8D3Q7_9CAUD|nr:capsid assembly scaffolding protein [Ralstonia phage P-PSG-11]QFP93724.1 capsid assembly scaffolding protein [Ralstonia phage P-PSG-11-1]
MSVDSVVIKQPEAPVEDQAHIDAMVAKVDAANTPTETDTPEVPAEVRPQWLPEKFKSPEDLAKAYAELEGKLGGKKDDAPPPADDKAAKSDETPDPDKATPDDASKALSEKGLSFDEFSAEFAQKGELTAESYEKLEKAGIPKAVVDQYIAGQQAIAESYRKDVTSVAGGDDKFAEMVTWAGANLSKEEIAAYNKAVDSGDINQAKLAVAGVYQKFDAAGRSGEPSLVTGAGGKVTGDVYESLAQMQKDMASPEYKADPAFRKKVEQKIARSNIL